MLASTASWCFCRTLLLYTAPQFLPPKQSSPFSKPIPTQLGGDSQLTRISYSLQNKCRQIPASYHRRLMVLRTRRPRAHRSRCYHTTGYTYTRQKRRRRECFPRDLQLRCL
ncbi:hypothetical protein B0H10DRAFT_1978658 [Mycena sp. CBHHK59/15]|nr:hypothetical protein B0H10DRAFT_1978658 [Mycena sp. CBHHK59/15]